MKDLSKCLRRVAESKPPIYSVDFANTLRLLDAATDGSLKSTHRVRVVKMKGTRNKLSGNDNMDSVIEDDAIKGRVSMRYNSNVIAEVCLESKLNEIEESMDVSYISALMIDQSIEDLTFSDLSVYVPFQETETTAFADAMGLKGVIISTKTRGALGKSKIDASRISLKELTVGDALKSYMNRCKTNTLYNDLGLQQFIRGARVGDCWHFLTEDNQIKPFRAISMTPRISKLVAHGVMCNPHVLSDVGTPINTIIENHNDVVGQVLTLDTMKGYYLPLRV